MRQPFPYLWAYCLYCLAVSEMSQSQSQALDAEYRIVGQGQIHKVTVGSSLHLDCPVSQLSDRPGQVMLWKKGHRVLTAGNMKVRRDPRIQLVNTDLEIKNIGVHDGGLYRCEVEVDANQPLAVVHTVEILVPPSVQPEPTNGEITVRSGASVNLECRANGNPSPTVSWSREEVDPLTSQVKQRSLNSLKHSLTNNGMVLTLHAITRAASGLYSCNASNGVGAAARAHIKLHVLFPPHVRAVQPVVEGGAGYEARLTCVVHSSPTAEVVWHKNSMSLENVRLDTRRGYSSSRDNRKHHLNVHRVGEEDFANYSCLASNSLGKAKAHIQLRGNPTPPQFDSKVVYMGPNSYQVSWLTTSFQDVLEYRLAWKKSGTYNDIVSPNWMTYLLTGPMKGAREPLSQDFVIPRLEQEQGYEARVKARNRYGWSDHSQTFYFYTGRNRPDMPAPSLQTHVTQINRNLAFATASAEILVRSWSLLPLLLLLLKTT